MPDVLSQEQRAALNKTRRNEALTPREQLHMTEAVVTLRLRALQSAQEIAAHGLISPLE